jgi:hypothetical protein
MFETIGSIPSTCSCEKINTTQRIDTPYIEVSHGELFDKVTILEIKSEQIADQKKLNNVATELNKLNKVLCTVLENNPSEKDFLLSLKNDLTTVNWEMWQVEDAIREKEATKEFDEEFITLARSVYLLNDLRCSIKRRISETLSSHIIEEKSYATSEE